MPLDLQVLHGDGTLEVELWTSRTCHLTLRWTSIEPVKTSIPKLKRGVNWYYDNKMCFVAWQDIEQQEAGDTLLHTFLWPGWAICNTRWFTFLGTVGGVASPSNTAIFKAHYKGATDMISLGKFGEAQVLLGAIKLKEGTGITITRVDADNALEIASTGGAAVSPYAAWPKYKWLLDNLAVNAFGHLATTEGGAAGFRVYYRPLIGDFALLSKLGEITNTWSLTTIYGAANQVLAPTPANAGYSMPTRIVGVRYIFYPQGFSASGVRGSALYRYDLLTNTWATMTSITTLGAGYRFNASMAFLWDGSDLIYAIGFYKGTDRGLAAYSITGDSWTELADAPLTIFPDGGAIIQAGKIYVLRGLGPTTFYRYNVALNTWDTMAVLPAGGGGGLTQDSADPNYLYATGRAAAPQNVDRYSISGDTWTALDPVDMPHQFLPKGHYYADPVPHLLLYGYGYLTWWLYKLPALP